MRSWSIPKRSCGWVDNTQIRQPFRGYVEWTFLWPIRFSFQENCGKLTKISGLYDKYQACNDRVNSKKNTTETCTEELFDYIGELDSCVAKTLFSKLKWMMGNAEIGINRRLELSILSTAVKRLNFCWINVIWGSLKWTAFVLAWVLWWFFGLVWGFPLRLYLCFMENFVGYFRAVGSKGSLVRVV